ncbi:MAG: class I SAM-dependent methyltransferase [Gemmataceae bacterium]
MAAGQRREEAEVGDLRQRFAVPIPADWNIVPRDPSSDVSRPAGPRPAALPSPDRADELFLRESLRHRLRQRHEPAEAYSGEWFVQIERERHERQAAWLPRLLEFTRHEGETLLGLGDGLGTDWVQYARHGTHVIVCGRDAEQLALVRANFESRALTARFRVIQSDRLALDDDSIDVVCLQGFEASLTDSAAAEVFRVLRPGGKIIAVLPARHNAAYWQRLIFPWLRLVPGEMREKGGPRKFTAAELRRQFDEFADHRVHKRHLKRHDVPKLFRSLPLGMAEHLMGRFLIWKAFKPLSASRVIRLAA